MPCAAKSSADVAIRLDNDLIAEVGLAELPAELKNEFLAQVYATLEMRVGMVLARQMSDEQLDEFEAFIDSNDEAGSLAWLEKNFPTYKQIVAETLEGLKAEIKSDSEAILAASAP